jgi:hypothetical protein
MTGEIEKVCLGRSLTNLRVVGVTALPPVCAELGRAMAYQDGRSITTNGRDYAARERELMMKQKGETEQDLGVTPDEMIARKEMEEGVRWAIRENFNEQQVNFSVPCALGDQRDSPRRMRWQAER